MCTLAFFFFSSTYERLVNTLDNDQLLSEMRVNQHLEFSTLAAPRHNPARCPVQANHRDAEKTISAFAAETPLPWLWHRGTQNLAPGINQG